MLFTATLPDFQTRFAEGLQAMLTPDGLGAFILVLANSMQDATLRQQLTPALQQTFAQLQQNQPSAPPDDLATFQALLASGIDSLTCWEYVQRAPWEVVINPLRALRPARVSAETFKELYQPFSADKFHFNKPFLRPEILWEGAWEGLPLRVLYNKFAFVPWHTLIVPEPAANLPQFLTAPYHERMMTLAAASAEYLRGFGIAFNSVGAYASVNHLHLQGFIRNSLLPIEAAHWQHNGGTQPYPLPVCRTDTAIGAWEIIQGLQQANQPYNLLYRGNTCYIMPRQGQGTVAVPEWSQGFGWVELCGIFNVTSAAAAQTLPTETLSAQLAALKTKNPLQIVACKGS